MMALMLAVVMCMAMTSMVAFADEGDETPATVKIEITRDGSYSGTGDGNTYKWYKVFSASYESNTATVGGHDESGNPLATENTATAVAYTATAAVAAKLGSWNATTKTWTKIEGNNWFELTPIAGTTNYSVKWVGADTSSATAQAAAKWLYDNEVWESTGDLSFADGKFSATDLEKGYYLINGVTGKNLVAATTDITIAEKNEYPSDDKKQADEDNATMTDDDKNVAIGDVLNYEVKVHIPATAKAGDLILVWDKASAGLTYNNNVKVKSGSNTGNATIGDVDTADQVAGATWQKLITVTAGSQDTDVVFEFTMTVNDDALTDGDKKNESGLKYGNEDGEHNKTFPYESTPDKVEYKTYFTGIKKIDGTSKAALAGVEFTLKEKPATGDAVEFKVSKVEGEDYYIYDANGSSTVVTDENGMIKIRGLDSDKTYTLTETKTLDGYNMLDEDKTLTLSEDTYTVTIIPAEGEGDPTTTTTESYTGKTNDTFDKVENNKGTVLPSTGGIGTTIFYVIGAILVLGAGILLVTRRRMRAE